MKKFDIKSIILGLVIGVIGVSSVSIIEKIKSPTDNSSIVVAEDEIKVATTNSSTLSNNLVKSATVSNAKVYFNGNDVKLKNPLIEVVKDESSEKQLYMPMSELLEYMHFKVEWNSKNDSVNLTMNGQNSNTNMDIESYTSENQVDKKAIDIIQKTGNWKYIDPYLANMSTDAIKKVVEIYNSKHTNPSEHKKASDYIKN